MIVRRMVVHASGNELVSFRRVIDVEIDARLEMTSDTVAVAPPLIVIYQWGILLTSSIFMKA